MNDMAPVDERAVSCGNDAFKWMVAHNMRWTSSERKVYSRKYGFAGTCDGTGIVDSCQDPECCPNLYVDMPSCVTSRAATTWTPPSSIKLVLTGKRCRRWVEKYEAMWVLKLGKEDGKFDAWFWNDFDTAFGGYLNCLNLSRSHREMVRTLAEAKKLVTFQKRENKKVATRAEKLRTSWEKKSAKAAAKAAKNAD